MLTALETTGKINSNHQIELDDKLPDNAPKRVRVIVLFDENNTDIDEQEWLRSAARNESLDFLADEGEDIYTLTDGQPFENEK